MSRVAAFDGRALFASLPETLRWADGGGSPIGGCNGYHIAPIGTRGTLCGRYGPATLKTPMGEHSAICRTCLRLAGIEDPRGR